MIFVILLLLAFLNAIASALFPAIAWTIIANFIYYAAIAVLFLLDPPAIWLLAPFVLLQASGLFSFIFIESGGYLVEMGTTGHPSMAGATFCCTALLLVGMAVFSWRWMRNPPDQPKPTRRLNFSPDHRRVSILFHLAFLAFAVFGGTYLILAGLRTGFPVLTATDRFTFRRLDADVITINLLNLKLIIFLGLGISAAKAQQAWLSLACHLAMMGLAAVNLLYGDKFFATGLAVVAYMTPVILKDSQIIVRKLIKLLPAFVICAGALSATTYFIYSDHGGRSFDATMEKLGDRVSGQGELWFLATTDNPALIKFDRNAAIGNALSILQKDPAHDMFLRRLGPFYFVHKYSPPRMYASFLHNEGTVTPTMGFEANGLVLFGFVGVAVMMIVSGFGLACLMRYVKWAIEQGNPFLGIIPGFLLNQASKMLGQGTIYSLVSVPTFKIVAAFLVVDVIVRLVAPALNGPPNVRRPARRGLQNGGTPGPPVQR